MKAGKVGCDVSCRQGRVRRQLKRMSQKTFIRILLCFSYSICLLRLDGTNRDLSCFVALSLHLELVKASGHSHLTANSVVRQMTMMTNNFSSSIGEDLHCLKVLLAPWLSGFFPNSRKEMLHLSLSFVGFLYLDQIWKAKAMQAMDGLMPGFDKEIAKMAQRVLINPRKIDWYTGVLATKVTPGNCLDIIFSVIERLDKKNNCHHEDRLPYL